MKISANNVTSVFVVFMISPFYHSVMQKLFLSEFDF